MVENLCSKHLKDCTRRTYSSKADGNKHNELNGQVTNGMQITGLH